MSSSLFCLFCHSISFIASSPPPLCHHLPFLIFSFTTLSPPFYHLLRRFFVASTHLRCIVFSFVASSPPLCSRVLRFDSSLLRRLRLGHPLLYFVNSACNIVSSTSSSSRLRWLLSIVLLSPLLRLLPSFIDLSLLCRRLLCCVFSRATFSPPLRHCILSCIFCLAAMTFPLGRRCFCFIISLAVSFPPLCHHLLLCVIVSSAASSPFLSSFPPLSHRAASSPPLCCRVASSTKSPLLLLHLSPFV